MRILIVCALLACASAQYVKTAGVKGGHAQGSYVYRGGENLVRIFGNSTHSSNQTQAQYGHNSQTGSLDYEKGVCYIEVPTASLVHGQLQVPAGNGSSPQLSRIRSCCKGYIRNIHNYKLCDPVCSVECVNALCSAPDTCTCFPDHVKNQAGTCVPTCPIGCHNGQCAGGECICNDGYVLDSESKYCYPKCRENCGGIGNCTAPNICQCREGYRSTPEGSCKLYCGNCTNGDCISPNECRCRSGYEKKQNQCVPQCSRSCGSDGKCVVPDVCRSPNLAGGHITQTQNHGSNQTSGSNYPYPQVQPINSNYPRYPNQGDRHYPANYPYPNQDTNHPNSNQVLPLSRDVNLQNPNQPYYPNYPNQNQQNPNFNQSSNYPVNQDNNNHQNPNQSFYPYYPNQNQQNPNSNQSSNYPVSQNSNHHQNPNQPNYPYYPNQNTNDNQSNNYPVNQDSNQPHNPNQPNYPYYPNQDPNNPHTNQGNNPNYPTNPNPTNNSPNQGFNNPTSGPNYPYPTNQHAYHSPDEPNYYPYYPNQPNYPSSGSQMSNQGSQNLYPSLSNGGEVPVCSQPCINGICIEGNRCSCNPGYVLDNADPTGTRCRPSCPAGCPNGICSAPNFCICNLGYFKDTSVKGRAACVKRIRRSADTNNAAEPLIFDIPDYY